MCGIDAKIQTYGIPVLDETVPSSVQKGEMEAMKEGGSFSSCQELLLSGRMQ